MFSALQTRNVEHEDIEGNNKRIMYCTCVYFPEILFIALTRIVQAAAVHVGLRSTAFKSV